MLQKKLVTKEQVKITRGTEDVILPITVIKIKKYMRGKNIKCVGLLKITAYWEGH